ncbi:MAG TPA: UDP-2,3-diacylglucosamine diphosphatase [Piscirickettsiaceae bacterium]|jgi:UDP-2,3-diacylglucosamine hydrolase|nr:UDP-2,3-diacylglucosamine diphosphatase [Piscirickettsiaceae bacterium]
MSSSLIIADLHLVSDEVDKTNLFIKFCQERASQADQLFILGDLFNAWLGDDLSLNHYRSVVDTLKSLGRTTKVFIVVGNRDFLLGTDFEQQTGCQLVNEPYLLETNDQQYVLIHGDSLCMDDVGYQQLKKVLQHPIIKFIFLRLPKKLRLKLSGQIRKKSVEAQQYKSHEIMDVNADAVDELMQKYPSANLIHGHTHRQNTHVGDRYTRYVLGDWSIDQGNAIEIDTELNWLEIN